MKDHKAISAAIIILNIIGIICLVYFAVPYITHDVTVYNPDAMLPAQAWDAAGMALTLGLIPLAGANTLCFIFVKTRHKAARFLFFLPAIICLVLVASYLIRSL